MAQCYPANNRKARSGQLSKRGIVVALTTLILSLHVPLAFALKSDNDQPMDVAAATSRIEADKQVSSKKTIYLHGNVQMVQGTIRAHSDDATIHMDKDDAATTKAAAPAKNVGSEKSRAQRVIMTGKLAHIEQMQDNDGGLMTGDAEKLDYKVNDHLVEMTGNVTVVQQKQGTFHGEHMIYNTLTGEMVSGDESSTSRIHITLPGKETTPDSKATDPTKPATTPPAITTPKKNKNKTPQVPAKTAPESNTTTTDGH